MFDQTDTTGVPTSDGPPAYQPAGSAGVIPDSERSASDRTVEIVSDEPTRKSTALGWVVTIAVAVVLTVLVKSFILQAYSIPSPSMVPTLKVGDRVVVFQLNTDPARGDIIVFNRPPTDPKTSPDDPDVLIKRVIGLPGETVDARDGKVFVDGKALVEDYLPNGTQTIITTPITVPKGQLLVLGDNRSQSFDGRFFGTISKDLIVGRAIARIWPLSRVGGL